MSEPVLKDEPLYNGKPLSSYSSWDLIVIERGLKDAELRREEASKHVKFNSDREVNGQRIKKINMPAINPNFINLKNAIEEEIRKRENV